MDQKEYDFDDIANAPCTGEFRSISGPVRLWKVESIGQTIREELETIQRSTSYSLSEKIGLIRTRLAHIEKMKNRFQGETPDWIALAALEEAEGLCRRHMKQYRIEVPSEPATIQQQRQETNTDGPRAADELLNRFFDWKRFLPLLLQDGVITPIDGLYRLCPRVRMPRKYFAMFLYQTARANARDKDAITKEARKIAWTFLKDTQGKNFSNKFYDQEFIPPPPVDQITNETAKKIIKYLYSINS